MIKYLTLIGMDNTISFYYGRLYCGTLVETLHLCSEYLLRLYHERLIYRDMSGMTYVNTFILCESYLHYIKRLWQASIYFTACGI
jgi:hypothetical protein